MYIAGAARIKPKNIEDLQLIFKERAMHSKAIETARYYEFPYTILPMSFNYHNLPSVDKR